MPSAPLRQALTWVDVASADTTSAPLSGVSTPVRAGVYQRIDEERKKFTKRSDAQVTGPYALWWPIRGFQR